MKYAVSLLFVFVFLLASTRARAQERWEAPAEADTLENPYSPDEDEIVAQGREMYVMLCAACHGDRGDGAGAAGQTWDPPPSDFTTTEVQQQSDGAIFWKIWEGNPPAMLSYKNMLSEEEVWQLVNYLRQFDGD